MTRHFERIKYGDYEAVIDLDRGGNCISLRKGKCRILREPYYVNDPSDYSGGELDNPYLYGMPILFPVNRISGGGFEFEGREYRFPINEPNTGCHLHGKLHETEFKLVCKETDKIVCRYEATTERPYLDFCHSFIVDIEYSLSGDGFTHTTCIKNTSDKNMPVMIGFHTTFNTLFASGKRDETFVFADISEEYERNMKNYLPTGNIPKFDVASSSLASGTFNPFSEDISRHYKAACGGRMAIYDKANKLSMIYENDEKYSFRLIFNRGGFICLEPQNCMADCANSPFGRDKTGFDCISSGEAKTYKSRIYIKEEI